MHSKLVLDGSIHSPAVSIDANPALTRIRLWDLPIRIFHWSLAIAVIVAIITGKIGGNLMAVHAKAGLTIIGLVAFRITWGIVGSTYARFLEFAPTPGKIKAYLKGQWHGVGHNPLGALSVFALLGLLAVQAGIGLFTNDDIAFNGPFYGLVDEALSARLSGVHHLLANVILSLLVLHVVAIVFYLRFKKDNLVKPMVTGWKEVESAKSGGSATRGSIVALLASILIALAVAYIASGALLAKTPATTVAPANSTPAW
ncbi:MAG: cytochrome b/b6 domain-containing protein [Burkholderiaceae bacterium]